MIRMFPCAVILMWSVVWRKDVVLDMLSDNQGAQHLIVLLTVILWLIFLSGVAITRGFGEIGGL